MNCSVFQHREGVGPGKAFQQKDPHVQEPGGMKAFLFGELRDIEPQMPEGKWRKMRPESRSEPAGKGLVRAC